MAAGTTKTDLPRPGDILRYVYLFHRESRDRDEGVKERPVVVIDADPATRQVAVVAVTTKGEGHSGTIALPDPVASAAGLSRGSAVVVSEYNEFTWLGFDIRPVAGGFVAGRLPPGFAHKVFIAVATGGAVAVTCIPSTAACWANQISSTAIILSNGWRTGWLGRGRVSVQRDAR